MSWPNIENNKKPAKIVYKGMTYNRGDMKETYGTVSSTIMMRIQEIADYVFEGSCVRVFEFYKLTESVFDHQKVGEIHPGQGQGSSAWIGIAVRDRFLGLVSNLYFLLIGIKI